MNATNGGSHGSGLADARMLMICDDCDAMLRSPKLDEVHLVFLKFAKPHICSCAGSWHLRFDEKRSSA